MPDRGEVTRELEEPPFTVRWLWSHDCPSVALTGVRCAGYSMLVIQVTEIDRWAHFGIADCRQTDGAVRRSVRKNHETMVRVIALFGRPWSEVTVEGLTQSHLLAEQISDGARAVLQSSPPMELERLRKLIRAGRFASGRAEPLHLADEVMAQLSLESLARYRARVRDTKFQLPDGKVD